jgi:hypothetical protein
MVFWLELYTVFATVPNPDYIGPLFPKRETADNKSYQVRSRYLTRQSPARPSARRWGTGGQLHKRLNKDEYLQGKSPVIPAQEAASQRDYFFHISPFFKGGQSGF